MRDTRGSSVPTADYFGLIPHAELLKSVAGAGIRTAMEMEGDGLPGGDRGAGGQTEARLGAHVPHARQTLLEVFRAKDKDNQPFRKGAKGRRTQDSGFVGRRQSAKRGQGT